MTTNPELRPIPATVDAAFDELVEAGRAIDRDVLGDSLLAFVRGTVALRKRLCAEHGAEAGAAIWSAAMDRHHRWMEQRYGLRDDA